MFKTQLRIKYEELAEKSKKFASQSHYSLNGYLNLVIQHEIEREERLLQKHN